MTVHATTEADGSAIVTIEGARRKVIGGSVQETRMKVSALVVAHAHQTGTPQRFVAAEPDGTWTMVVYPDGRIENEETAAEADSSRTYFQQEPATPHVTERRSFLRNHAVERPATRGWRGAATRAGLRMSPSEAEAAERADVRAVSQHWPGPRTIAMLNGKGGVGKTMTTINLAAVFARNGGAGVLAWDNNQTRGTLGWSTEQGPHEATILNLLPQVPAFLGPSAQGSDLARYVHHQTTDKFDVLRSKPEVLATEQRFDGETVDEIHRVASKFYRLIFMDSGNDETDPMWIRAVELSQQIVVPTIAEAKGAESAALLLESLAARGGHFARLAENAVVIVSQHKYDVPRRELKQIASGFERLAREVVTIPYDPALGADLLSYESMQSPARRAWLSAAAAVARGL